MLSRLFRFIGLPCSVLAGVLPAHAQFNISGVADKASPYANTASFTIGIQTGYSYAAFLNGERIPVGVPITVNEPDFYQIHAFATNVNSGVVSTQWVRFIVEATVRGGTEWGIPPHVPAPPIPSAAAEFAGASLHIIVPQNFPAGYEIPVVAWVVNDQGTAIRVNGSMGTSGHPSIEIKRGVGSGFLAANSPAGPLVYLPQIKGVQTNKTINIEASTVWTSVSGTLSGATIWPDNSRIRVTGHISVPAGSTLSVGAGTIVQLNPGVNITNNGSILISGITDRPVVFMPQSRAQPWGGFFMRTSTGILDATGTIFTGSGADPNGGAGHRDEQCLFFCASSPRITLTDSAAIYLAGQFGHSDNGSATFNCTRFLLQRATTGGEYTGANFTVNDSAFIEFPSDSVIFENEDHDALYLVSGSHMFTNTMFGWTKDDGIDSGGDGAARIHYERCWFEATFHEGNSLSGLKNTTAFQTVFLNCGQGIEDGYGAGTGGPTGRVDTCLFALCQSGVRHGDNYPSIGNGYPGRIGATNSLFFQNHRDVFGFNWRTTGWTNATGQMTIVNNWLSAPDIYFPNNAIWNPTIDAPLLAPFMSTPPGAVVGVGLAVRTNRFALTALADGVPVRLSSFTTNFVSVSYAFYTGGVQPQGQGTLNFAPGETIKRIYPANIDLGFMGPWMLRLTDASGADLTGLTNALFEGSISTPQVSLAVSGSILPGYRLAEGTFVRLKAATAQPVTVNYTILAGGNAVGSGTIAFNPPETMRQIFVTEVSPSDYPSIQITLTDPVGATLTGITEVTYNTGLSISLGVSTNQLDRATFASGVPVGLSLPAAATVSVDFAVEGDSGVLTNGTLAFTPGTTLRQLLLPTVNALEHDVLRVSLANVVNARLVAPSNVFFLPMAAPASPLLVTSNSFWRYLDTGVNAGTAWRMSNFDDSSWASGCAELGYMDNDECTVVSFGPSSSSKYITTYFRQRFEVANATAFTNLSLWLLRDDGGVVYINGTEVYRSPSMPQPPTVITYQTLATNQSITTAPADDFVDRANVNPSVLVSGTNVVAVEIHQHRADSSDISFDFALTGMPTPQTPPQSVYTVTLDGKLHILWADPSFRLEQTEELKSTGTVWTPVPGPSPVAITFSPSQRFFRLTRP